MTHLYQQLVHFVACDCEWPIEAQAQGSHLNESTLRAWLAGRATPRPRNFDSWADWACDECEGALFNPFGPQAGRWVPTPASDVLALAPGWSASALLGRTRWALVCRWRGQVERIEIGEIPKSWDRDELLDALSANVRLLCRGRGILPDRRRGMVRSLERLRVPPLEVQS